MISLDEQQLRSVVNGFQIPAKPEILTEIQSLMAEDEPDIMQVASVITRDIALSSAILKIINSPLYGMNRRISEIKQAVMMLGLETVNALVTALLLKASMGGDACISLERFWDDALDIANAMTFIGSKIKNEIPVDMLFTIGLFHDCGVPLLALKYPNYKELIEMANNQQENTMALEEKHYPTNHATLGYFVASSWHLPKELCQLILRHHDKTYVNDIVGCQEQLAFCVLKMAENMVERVKRHAHSPDWLDIKEACCTILGISEEDYTDIEDDYFEVYEN